MKNLIYFLFLSLLCFSCSDPCDDVVCGPGSCDDGTCVCPDGFSGTNCEIQDLCVDAMCINGNCNPETGNCDCDDFYEGDNCELEERAKFFGDWESTDFLCDGDGSPDDAETNFSKGENINELILIFGGDDTVQILVIVDGNTYTIPFQEHSDGFDTFTVEGNGTLDNGVLSLTVMVTSEGEEDYSCTGTFTK